MKAVALLTCYNRRASTLACLEALFSQKLPPLHELEVVVVDDGSSDGTGEAIRARFPGVELLRGDGNLYWCGGMRRAWRQAAERDPDYYLLVNDDTALGADALDCLLKVVGGPEKRRIGVGAICDLEGRHQTYGGWRRRGGLHMVFPAGVPEECETFNANCALVPRAVYREMGMLHGAFTHGMGDFDYGFQATRRGIAVVQTGTFVGGCDRNPVTNTWRDRSLPRWTRLRKLHDLKSHPWPEAVEYHRRNSGWLWWYRCLTPYFRILLGR